MSESSNMNLLSEAQVSELTGLDRVTLYRLRVAGKIGFFKLGKTIRYSPEHVQKFLQSHERVAAKAK